MGQTLNQLYKRVAIPIPLSETACGDDAGKWRRRLALLKRQRQRLTQASTSIAAELERVERRIANAQDALETPPPPPIDHLMLRRPMRADRTGGGLL